METFKFIEKKLEKNGKLASPKEKLAELIKKLIRVREYGIAIKEYASIFLIAWELSDTVNEMKKLGEPISEDKIAFLNHHIEYQKKMQKFYDERMQYAKSLLIKQININD